MKRSFKYLGLVVLLLTVFSFNSKAQLGEAEQLLATMEKYNQSKKMLNQVTQGYQVVKNGYDKIKDVASGNFNLHNTFINGLMAVSPAVRKYRRIPDIINYQVMILSEYKSSFLQFKKAGRFNEKELSYMGRVYSNLLEKSSENIEELTMVITANKTQMTDDERIQAIDRIYADIQDKFLFLKKFNGSTKVLALQRGQEKGDIEVRKGLNGTER
ncbi:hypothetical protein AAKU52_002634 [Pedobacter sp. CG_S7]|uniref:TerB family tellurite resistance protein n=1 Tax=Pedobacter sp. CG_S7 TaxID=3143930 RepID=UPI0033908AE2